MGAAVIHRLVVLVTHAALVLAGSAVAPPRPGPAVRSAVASPTPGPATASRLTDAQLAGQRVIYSYAGLTPPARLLGRIRAGQAAGVIFFSDNISSESQIHAVARQLEQAAAHSPVKTPLLLMTDQEGGLVHRLPGAPTLSEKQVGAASNPGAAARAAGRGAGQNLAGVGMNVNLAPVLDVYRSTGNFIDEFGRSYSSRAGVAARLGADFISAQQRLRVAATAKHFPGLGAAARSQNTDLVPVRLGLSLHSLRTVDEIPYTSAIDAGVKLVMVSWATYPALDSHRPAGLSPAVVGGELRKRLGFRGVTITDALEAGALRGFGSTGNRALLAAGAGMDLILCASQSTSQGIAAQQGLLSALQHGRLGRSGFTAAANRVLALRQALR